MASSRLIWADSLKGILILLVVLGHAIQYTIDDGCYTNHLWNIIYSFHMPAFMAMSGFFAYRIGGSKNNVIQTIYRRFRQLLIPYLLWTFLLMIICNNLKKQRIWELFLYPDKGLWFLWVLFFIAVLFILCEWLAKTIRIKQELFVVLACFILALSMILFKTKIFSIQLISYYFLFYSLGYYAHKHYEVILSIKARLIVLLILLWSVLAWFWQMQDIPSILKGVLISETIILYMYRFCTATIAITVLLKTMPLLLNSGKVWNKPFMKLGQISLGIYSINFLVLGNLVPLIKQMVQNNNMVIFLSFVLGSLCAWCVIWLLSKWKVTTMWLLGKV